MTFRKLQPGFGPAKNDFELVKSIGIQETGILVSCSDYHIFNKMGLTRQQAMGKYLGVVKEPFLWHSPSVSSGGYYPG